MTEDDRRRFESLGNLRQAAYASFNDRRVYEWKLNLAIWTALAVLLAGLLQPSKVGEAFPLHGTAVWVSAVLLGGLIATRANAIDKGVALHYAGAMQDMLALPFATDLQKRIDAHPKQVGWRQWAPLAQVAITALLALASIAIVFVRSS
jgi:hypothetical protein